MARLGFIMAVLWVTLFGLSGTAETWECGESTAYSISFVLDTDNSPCDSDTVTFGPLAIETDLTQCDTSTGAIDQPMMIDTVWSPGTMKKHPLGERVTLLLVPISRTFSDRFYIESLDRTPGIGVMQAITADPGRLATVTGTVGTFEGEVVLTLPEVVLGDLGDAPKPLGMNSSALLRGSGLDTTGILATVWGRAVAVPQGKTWYLVSDGGVPFTVAPEGVSRPGEGNWGVLTGVPGAALVDGHEVRVFRVNGQ